MHEAADADGQLRAAGERVVALVAVGLEIPRAALQEARRVLVLPVRRVLIGDEAGVADVGDPAATYTRWLQRQGKEPPPCPPTLP